MQLFDNENILTLQQALDMAGRAIQRAFPDRFWLIAEIAQVSSSKGHVYLELVQKDPCGTLAAKTKAMIWASNARTVLGGFTANTGQALGPGMNALMCCSINWHAVYGLGFQVHAIDSDYTLGEMARQKRDVIERLTREGLIEYNKDLPFPLVAQRIAIVSSRTAAGYEDFCHQLDFNTCGFRFTHTLFEARMQGDEAERTLIEALHKVRLMADRFDALVLIRGGGSKIDLHCFDGYAVAKELATFPLPVITGIGHERDDSVADMVAHHRCKTPTAVAEFLIRRALDFEEALQELQMRVVRAATSRLESGRHLIEQSVRCLQSGVMQAVSRQTQSLRGLEESLRTASLLRLERERGGLERIGDKVGLLDPINVLRRGYSLVYTGETLVRSAADVQVGASVRVVLADGSLAADVTAVDLETDGRTNSDAV